MCYTRDMCNRKWLPSKNLQGRRVRLITCNDAYTKIPAGTLGTVSLVDDVGTVHVNWDNGSTLGLCWEDGDRWSVLPDKSAADAMMARYK